MAVNLSAQPPATRNKWPSAAVLEFEGWMRGTGGRRAGCFARPSVFSLDPEPMDVRHHEDSSNEERRRRERPIWMRALGVSLVVHALVFLVFPVQSILISPFAAAGPRAGSDRAAKGSMQAMNMQVPPSIPIVPPPIPLPSVENIEPVEFDPEPFLEPAALSGETLGLDEGPGLEDGTGEGDGGTTDEGLYRLVPPQPLAMFLSMPNDDGLKGREVEVWVFVDASGHVVPDSTQLRPRTPNRAYNRKLMRDAAEWVFTPAQNQGQAIASWFNYRFRVGG